jgi:hypothetical protein
VFDPTGVRYQNQSSRFALNAGEAPAPTVSRSLEFLTEPLPTNEVGLSTAGALRGIQSVIGFS